MYWTGQLGQIRPRSRSRLNGQSELSPEKPSLIKTLNLGRGSGPHYIALTDDEQRLVISDYFLNEDDFGKVHAEADHKVHIARVMKNDLILDPRFELDFNTAFASGPARPHGIAIK